MSQKPLRGPSPAWPWVAIGPAAGANRPGRCCGGMMAFFTGRLGRLWPLRPGGRFFLLQHVTASPSQPRTISILSDALGQPPSTSLSFRSAGIFQSIPRHLSPWSLQQIRTKARGNEYQPKNLKRKRTHGWIKRIRTPSGIEVILRRMLKCRKSLSH
ncbi:39S ribosomal protein L34, mitochondrial [Mauremys reevesii]|uniref:39S ribosomal protein L34, mitochondrial n=1 Tax=Mauremys reevesii TaxID=260615 RepID=UPI00193F2741|nr:39S ribosomal protein L34, mitochondrial [Mauremys reevesii]